MQCIGRIYNLLVNQPATVLKMERSMSTAAEVCSDKSNLNEKCKSRKAKKAKALSIKIKQIHNFAIGVIFCHNRR